MGITDSQKPATKNGFTTLEIIFVVALLSLIVIAIAPFFRATVAGWELKDRQLEILQNGRVGMDEMVRTIKSAKQFTTIDASYIEFMDADGIDVEFRLNSGALEKRETGTQWDALAEPADPLSFTELSFTYYDKNSDETSGTVEVRSIKIAMVVSDSEGKVDPVTFNSQVTLRKDYYSLAINEINYNPPGSGGDEREREWVELYNYGTTDIDLTGWQITGDILQSGNGTMIIPAGGYAIITADPTQVYTFYTVDPGAIKLRIDERNMRLADNSDTITILDSYESDVDSVTYYDTWGGDGNGDTVERENPKGPSNEQNNWEASSETNLGTPNGRTPGFANSVTIE